jgi:hypothetical protein
MEITPLKLRTNIWDALNTRDTEDFIPINPANLDLLDDTVERIGKAADIEGAMALIPDFVRVLTSKVELARCGNCQELHAAKDLFKNNSYYVAGECTNCIRWN